MRTARDFNEREAPVREWLLHHTWCESCKAPDLGMTDPAEYEEDGVVYVEGRCARCGSVVISSIEQKDVP